MTRGGPDPDRHREPDDRGSNTDALSHFFAGPTDEHRARVRADLRSRVAQVRVNGWEPYRGVWSRGEVIGVAALLGDLGELAAIGETLQSAWERWAFDLWGLSGGQSDVDNGSEVTREWFAEAAHDLDDESVPRELLSRAAESPTIRRARTRRTSHSDRRDDSK